ncbi:unnamed protein product [Heligmosomoides polygyrus]|uniref:Ig-like domain-containing protein n=1 Tax=Heligmosomoides polygyrus TaxID=6339 RepID=A0A183G1Z0_HELPZ|nr:unnamed protein product [Heligmosomoides polygyrus]
MEEIRNAIQTRNQHMCRPKFVVKPRPKKVLEEFKSLRLKTAISANPTPTVHWDREGVMLETGNKYSIYNDGDFYYLEVEVVKATEDSSTAQERRRSKKTLKAPSFIEVLPGKIKATACEPLSIECSVAGYPAPAIRWLRNGAPLLPNVERYVMSYDGECATLKFALVSVADEGVYTCEARNECGEAKAQVVQLSFSPSKWKTYCERQPISPRLGSEPLQIQWIRNRVLIPDSQSFQYARDGANVCLVIADAFPEDGGEYAVEARNQYGTARCIMRLDIHSWLFLPITCQIVHFYALLDQSSMFPW